MKHQGYLELQRKKEAEALVQNELANLRNQVATLQAQNLEKDKVVNAQSNSINQLNSQLSSLQNNISAKNSQINSLQNELSAYKNSTINIEQSLKQKDSMIELLTKNVEEMRLEKQELKEDKKYLKELLASTEDKLKEKDLHLSILEKQSNKLDGLNISGIFKDGTVQSIYPSDYNYKEKHESKLVAENSSFENIEEHNEN